MSAIDTAAVRDQLARTGRLHTPLSDDPGFLSDYWRAEIARLCAAVDAGCVVGVPIDQVELEQAQIEGLFGLVRNVVAPDLEAKVVRLTWLVENAIPRMRTLNNEFSQRWLAMTEALFDSGGAA